MECKISYLTLFSYNNLDDIQEKLCWFVAQNVLTLLHRPLEVSSHEELVAEDLGVPPLRLRPPEDSESLQQVLVVETQIGVGYVEKQVGGRVVHYLEVSLLGEDGVEPLPGQLAVLGDLPGLVGLVHPDDVRPGQGVQGPVGVRVVCQDLLEHGDGLLPVGADEIVSSVQLLPDVVVVVVGPLQLLILLLLLRRV